MTEATWHRAGRALLGSWPERVASWGEEGIAAYVEELQARGVSADAALTAIRSCPADQRFPPSAPELAALARRDPSQPTGAELLTLIYGRCGVLRARPAYPDGGWSGNEFSVERDDVQQARAFELHPLLGAFVRAYGLDRLRMLQIDDPDWGEKHRRDLTADWERFVEANEGREVASLVAGRRGDGLRKLDPLRALSAARGASHLELAS